ncbi:MAG TPA: MFS transporter [Symbiobacteriaceae bacterium]|nr:MFS transporter [Symbiobacteriaceae bacterium]
MAAEPISTPKDDSLWRNRTFLTVWLSHGISVLGDGFHSVAVGLLLLQQTGSAAAFSAVLAVRVAAMILLGPFAGTFADRVDRRRLMIVTDLLRAVLVLALLLLLVLPAGASLPLVPVVIGLTLLIHAAGTFFGPAFGASLVQMVTPGTLGKANSLLQLTETVAGVAGPALGGMAVGLIGSAGALSVDAGSFLLSGLAILLVRFPSPRRTGESRFLADMAEGLAFLRGQPVILGVMLLGPLFSLFGAAHGLLMPVIAIRIWGVTPFQFGLIESAWPLGMGLAALLLTVAASRIKQNGPLLVGAFAVAGLFEVASALVPRATPALVLLVGSAFATGLGLVIMRLLLRSLVPPEMQGRAFGLYGSAANAAYPLGALMAGLLGDWLSPVAVAAACGVGFFLTAVVGWANPSLRRFG